jgi:hypothetical protein
MCRFRLAIVGLVVTRAVSTSGLAALAVKVAHKKNGAHRSMSSSQFLWFAGGALPRECSPVR